MSQKVTIRFCAREYKYHYDCLRIHGDTENLLIPIHAYPVINKVDFPKQLSFGNCPLSEPAHKTITLRCSIPVSFAYEIEVVQPHPYFNIQPLKGVIPADGSIDIRVSFDSITLGTCTTVVRLLIAQHNFTPIETVINARAVSGLIENRELIEVEKNLAEELLRTSTAMASSTKVKTMKGSMTATAPGSTAPGPKKGKRGGKRGVTYRDPVALVLEKTFKSTDIGTTLTKALPDTHLLGSKVPHMNASGIADVIGSKKITQPLNPRGVGSGKGMDAGAEWATMHSRKVSESKSKHGLTGTAAGGGGGGTGSYPGEEEKSEKVVEGLRIPPQLGSVAAVNFVLTQEIGKLKPKDLKIAIEKNRAVRKVQAEEQQKIRDEGGGGTGGELDLRAVLADEKLNLEKGDPFKRQLREMAFLADVDELKTMEIEKGFRVSEEFLGSSMLSEEDLQTVRDQRRVLGQHRARTEWRKSQKRMRKEHFLPLSEVVRAGAPIREAPVDGKPQETPLPSSFDTNKNDIWSKRMHSLRKLISCVSKYIIQQRVMKRYHGLMDRFADHGVVDIESAKAFVAADAAAFHRPLVPKQKQTNNRILDKTDNLEDYTLAQVICSMPNQALEKRKLAEQANLTTYTFNKNMTRRVLFPKFIIDEGSTRKKIIPVSVDDPMGFDDRTFFPLKTRADFIDMHYHAEDVPPPPLYFLPADSTYLPRQMGASEEKLVRPAADFDMTSEDISGLAELDSLFSLSKFPLPPPSGLFGVPSELDQEHKSQVQFESTEQEDEEALLKDRGGRYEDASIQLESEFELDSAPSWLTDTRGLQPGQYHLEPSADPDVYRTRPEFRTYMSQLDSKEIDPDYDLRPGKILKYEPDSSFRTDLLSKPGFLSAHTYILGSYASRIRDPPPPPGPTITNFYMPDQDRHCSGLFCFANDHTRATMDPDPEMAPLQSRLAREDYLTDSESDDEDGYVSEVVTLTQVRALLQAHKPAADEEGEEDHSKGAKGAKKGAKTEPPKSKAEVEVQEPPESKVEDDDAFSTLGDDKKKHDQVELIRDRKMLDYNLFINNARKAKMDIFTDKLKAISESCACPLQALEVQLPLHHYEDELLAVLDDQVPELSNSFVEQDLSASRSTSPTKELR
jgi:hypothetical protein